MSGSILTSKRLEEEADLYGDSCDFGKFALNPCRYIFEAFHGFFCKRESRAQQDDAVIVQSNNTNRSRWSRLPLQSIYVASFLAIWTEVFIEVFPQLQDDPTTKVIGIVACVLQLTSWAYARRRGPGNITSDTMAKFDNYAYDDLLYENFKICPTLGIRKLARSKYHCGRHIPRFDHYCGWLKQTVGEENCRFFLLFVTTHVVTLWYGVHKISKLPSTTSVSQRLALWFITFVALVLTGFLTFHVYIICQGMTTNEYYKWKVIKKWHVKATNDYRIQRAEQQQQQQLNGTTITDEEDCTNWLVDPGRFPSNLYNLGVMENVMEVLYPRSIYKNGVDKSMTHKGE